MSVSSHQVLFNSNHPSMPPDVEELARDLFERACPSDSFDDLKRRAAFNRQEAGRLSIGSEPHRRSQQKDSYAAPDGTWAVLLPLTDPVRPGLEALCIRENPRSL